MESRFKFEKLKIWDKAMDLGDDIDKLSSQIRRASDSIALNISEGAIGQSNQEQKKFVGYAIRSLAEVVTCLHKVQRRNYIEEKEFENFYERSFHLMNMMIAFRNKL